MTLHLQWGFLSSALYILYNVHLWDKFKISWTLNIRFSELFTCYAVWRRRAERRRKEWRSFATGNTFSLFLSLSLYLPLSKSSLPILLTCRAVWKRRIKREAEGRMAELRRRLHFLSHSVSLFISHSLNHLCLSCSRVAQCEKEG